MCEHSMFEIFISHMASQVRQCEKGLPKHIDYATRRALQVLTTACKGSLKARQLLTVQELVTS